MNKAKNTDIYAQPDGTFHWTKKHKRILLEIEETNPFDSINYVPKSWRWQTKNIVSENPKKSETLIENYINDIIAGEQYFSKETWLLLLDDFCNESEKSRNFFIYEGVLSRLSQIMTFTELLEVLVLIIWQTEQKASQFFKNKVIYPYDNMYRRFQEQSLYALVQEQPQQKLEEVLPYAEQLIEQYPSPMVKLAMFSLFPNNIQLAPADRPMLNIHMLRPNIMRFFNHPDIFGFAYAQIYAPWQYNDKSWSEHCFLLMIKHKGISVLQMVEQYFRACSDNRGNFKEKHLTKVRKNLKLLDSYHHVDVLHFLLPYSHEADVITFINKWIDRYPIFVLTHLLYDLSELKSVQKSKIKALIKKTLKNNPKLLEPLRQSLQTSERRIEIEHPEFTISRKPPIHLLNQLSKHIKDTKAR